jgi:citrate synthase
MADHEQTWINDREDLAKAQEEVRRLKAQLKERQKDYSNTIKEMAALLPGTAQDADILREVAAERVRQDDKWGEQNHPDGTGRESWRLVAEAMKIKCESRASRGELTFRDIFEEEIWEAYAEKDESLLRAELVQSAAVLVNWIGAIDRRKRKENESEPKG